MEITDNQINEIITKQAIRVDLANSISFYISTNKNFSKGKLIELESMISSYIKTYLEIARPVYAQSFPEKSLSELTDYIAKTLINYPNKNFYSILFELNALMNEYLEKIKE